MNKNFIYYIIYAITVTRFNLVRHSYIALFLIKIHFYATKNFFYFKNWTDLRKKINFFCKCVQNGGDVTLGTFRTFACICSYLQIKNFAQKRHSVVSTKLQIPRHWSRLFQKALTSFYKRPEKQAHWNSPRIFHELFNFWLLFTFKLLQIFHYFDKTNQTVFRNFTLASQSRSKFTFLRQSSKK